MNDNYLSIDRCHLDDCLLAWYTIRVERILQRQLSQSERDTVSKFFSLGYSVNYTAEYLR